MKKAFTLIELLVVVLIIGILAAVALPQYEKAVLKTRYVQLMVLQDAVERAEDVYYLANGEYTSKFDELDIEMPNGTITYDENEQRSLWVSGKYSIYLTSSWSQGYYEGLSYIRGHSSHSRTCRSYNRTEQERSICLSMGGVKSECSSCEYDIYVL